MRTQAGLMVAVLIAVLGLPTESPAQQRRGLFGDRELGKPLAPRASRFRSGLERGPSGNFLGRTTADRGTTFQSRSRPEPTPQFALPPEAYNLEPEMVPAYLEEQARRMAAAHQQQQRQLEQLHARQAPQQSARPSFPPAVPQQPNRYQPPLMPQRPNRYQPPPMSTQPGFPQPQPGVRGPAQQPSQQNSPDRWFRGAPTPTQPGQQVPMANPATSPQRSGQGPAGTLGPSGVRGQTGLNRSNPATLGARITQTLGARGRAQISATVRGDTVTLQGTVATATDRHLAEQLAAMEPGVRRIDNRITVVVAPPGP